MATTDIIKLDEVDDYLKLVEHERELLILLTHHKEALERQTKTLERIYSVTQALKEDYRKVKKKPKREEIIKAISRYARGFG